MTSTAALTDRRQQSPSSSPPPPCAKFNCQCTPPHTPGWGEEHSAAGSDGRAAADSTTAAEDDQMSGRPAMLDCIGTGTSLASAAKKREAVREVRLGDQRPAKTAIPLGRGEAAVGVICRGMKTSQPSLTATGAVCVTVEHDKLTRDAPALARNTMWRGGSA